MMSYVNYASLLARPNLLDEIDRELATRRLREFVVQAWPVIEPTTHFVPGWHLDAICEHLEAITRGHIRNLLITVPPRHMKSLSVSVFWLCWEWICWHERRWLYASYAETLSIRDSVQCRRLIQSPWYRRGWGDRFLLTGDQNEKRRFEKNPMGHPNTRTDRGCNTWEWGHRGGAEHPKTQKEGQSVPCRQA